MASNTLSFPLRLAYAVIPVAIAGIAGNFATMPNIPTWYAGLAKPGFNPPNWIFGPVWTLLYILMALAFFRILSLPASPSRGRAIAVYLAQILLNGLWSWAFFAAHSPIAGLLVILALDVAILATIASFWSLDRPSGWLLVPYLGWTLFATLLNFSIWRLN